MKAKEIKNPFTFGKVVTGKNFFNRKQEREEIKRLIRNKQNLILYSPRRYGKTSLILKIFEELRKKDKKFKAFLVDFYTINSVEDFISVFANEYAKNSELTFQKILNKLKNLIRGITPSLTIDNYGVPRIEISVHPNAVEKAFDDVIVLPQKLAKNNFRVAVFFDEFQESVNLKDFGFQKKLRSYIQHQTNVSYIFCGSKQHLFENIFKNPNAPLFKIGESKYLEPIPKKEYVKFITRNFRPIRKDFTNEIAEKIYDIAGPIPFNIQFFCHHLFNACLLHPKEDLSTLTKETTIEILEKKNEEFLFIYDSLSFSSRRALEIIVNTDGKNLFHKNVIGKYVIAPSTLKKALDTLTAKGILIKSVNKYSFADVFFKKWFERNIHIFH